MKINSPRHSQPHQTISLDTMRHWFEIMADELWLVCSKYPELVLLLLIAAGIRLYQLPTHLIFFGDIGRDFLAAQELLKTGEIPLLGIPSSVPRFHQGPVSIWLIALGLGLFDNQPAAVGVFFAALQLVAMSLGFFFVRSKSRFAGIIFLLIFTFSPLAIAHARMPYHITPLPVAFILYFWSLVRWKQGEKWGGMWSTLTFGLLFQFELAMAPLALLIPWVAWQRKKRWPWREFIVGGVIGLLPQILYDLTHRFEHLGGFVIWIGYRLAAFVGYKGEHTVSVTRLTNTAESSLTYLQRVFVFDQPVLAMSLLAVVVVCLIWLIGQRKRLTHPEQLVVVSTLLLSGAYLIHGSPSEAYFPPFLILLPAIIAFTLSRVIKSKMLQLTTVIFFISIGMFNVFQINKSNWFVEPTKSNFQYGQSLQEMEQVVKDIVAIQPEGEIALRSTDPDSQFASYLDGYRFLLMREGRTTTATTQPFFMINRYIDEVESYPGSYLIRFPSTILVVIP